MKVDSRLLEQWRQRPDQPFRLILRVSAALDQADNWLKARGIQVRRRCKLIQGFAIESTGAQAMGLLEEPWAVSCELDAEVRAWPASGNSQA